MARPRLSLARSFALFGCGVAASLLVAISPGTNSNVVADVSSRAIAQAPVAIDQKSERQAEQLVETYLPELKAVLKRLRTDDPLEYAHAIGDLARSARKLELAKSRGDGFLEVEVELLQSQTEVNLLTARLKVRDNPSDRRKLRSAVERLQNAQLARGEHEVAMLRGRLKRTQQQLDAATKRLQAKRENPQQQLERSYLSLLRKAGRQPPPNQNSTKPRPSSSRSDDAPKSDNSKSEN